MKHFFNKLSWWWRRFQGRLYIIVPVQDGLKKDEILVCGHKIYVLQQDEKEEEEC